MYNKYFIVPQLVPSSIKTLNSYLFVLNIDITETRVRYHNRGVLF